MPKEKINSDLTNTDTKWLRRATRLARMGTCRTRHGAVIVKGGRLLSVGINVNRNSPQDKAVPPTEIAVHAEEAALRALGGEARGAKIYVARVLRNDQPALSRPCDRCYEAIVAAGIKEIIYT